MIPAPPRFTPADFEAAHARWGANCGPGALAAIMGMTLEEIRPHLRDFDRKRYMNPTHVNEALRSIGRPWRKIGAGWAQWGLVRVQWEGPWTEQGVPHRARYRRTHWVGSCVSERGIGVFDVNALGNGSGWASYHDWANVIAPWIISACVPGGNGRWHLTHAIEVDPAA